MKIQKEELNKKKKKIELEKEEYNKKLEDKYKEQMKSELNKYKVTLKEQIELSINKIKNENEKKYLEREIEREQKFIEISQIMKSDNRPKEDKLTMFICNTIHHGVKCKQCYVEPIVGYRYKCHECENYNLCQNCEEKNSKNKIHPHNFIKIRESQNKNIQDNNDRFNLINDNNEDDNRNYYNLLNENEYSYECLNIMSLTRFINKGINEVKFEINLRNNGKKSWPIGNTKLIYSPNGILVGDDIQLQSQEPGEEGNYEVIFQNLKDYPEGEYKSILSFIVNGKNIGNKLELKVVIKKKNINEIEEHMDDINQFRQEYQLPKEDFSDERLLEALKNNNFNNDSAFQSLYN